MKSALSKMFNGWLNGILHLIQFFQTLYGHDPLCNGSKEYFDCEIGEVILVVLAAVAKTVTGTIIIDSKILGILFGAFFNVLNAIIIKFIQFFIAVPFIYSIGIFGIFDDPQSTWTNDQGQINFHFRELGVGENY